MWFCKDEKEEWLAGDKEECVRILSMKSCRLHNTEIFIVLYCMCARA